MVIKRELSLKKQFHPLVPHILLSQKPSQSYLSGKKVAIAEFYCNTIYEIQWQCSVYSKKEEQFIVQEGDCVWF